MRPDPETEFHSHPKLGIQLRITRILTGRLMISDMQNLLLAENWSKCFTNS